MPQNEAPRAHARGKSLPHAERNLAEAEEAPHPTTGLRSRSSAEADEKPKEDLILKNRPLPESETLGSELDTQPVQSPSPAKPRGDAPAKSEAPEYEDQKTRNTPLAENSNKDSTESIHPVVPPAPKPSAPSTDKPPETKQPQRESEDTPTPETPSPTHPKTVHKTTAAEEPRTKIRGKHSAFYNIGIGQDKTYFIENLAMLLVSGMNIISALDSIKAGLKSNRMRKIVEELKIEVDQGVPVWQALDNTGLLSTHAVALIKIGEESGRLSANLKVIATQEQKEKMFRSKVTSALMYPVIILFFTLVVGIGIAWFILPKLSGVFNSLDIKLPITTKILLNIGAYLDKNGLVVVPAFLVLLFIMFYFLFFFPKTKFIGQKIIFRIPGINILVQQIELSRFGFILGTLLSAGMPLVNALKSLEEISTFREYKRLYRYLASNIEDGNSFQKCFAAYKSSNRLIPFPVQQMIVAAEQSGNLKGTLTAIGDNFEEKTDISTKNLSVALEPILLFVIWAVVVFVALSVIMPIYSLIGGFNK